MVVNDMSPAFDIMMTNISSLVGVMVLDTACQRMCCGTQWLSQQVQHLSHYRLTVKHVETCEAFQFGRGQPITAKDRVYMPVSLGGRLFLIGSSVVNTRIPLLASNTFLEQLDTVVDLGKQQVFFRAIDVVVPIQKINGHLAVSISDFPSDVHQHHVWHELSKDSVWNNPHPEILAPKDLISLQPRQHPARPSGVFAVSDAAPTSSSMASSLEDPPQVGTQLGVHHIPMDVPDGQVGKGKSSMVDAARALGTQAGAGEHDKSDHSASMSALGMHTPRVEQVRQPDRPLRQVHSVPHQETMGANTSAMGGNWARTIGKLFFAAALTFKHLAGFIGFPDGNHLQVQTGVEGNGQEQSEHTNFHRCLRASLCLRRYLIRSSPISANSQLGTFIKFTTSRSIDFCSWPRRAIRKFQIPTWIGRRRAVSSSSTIGRTRTINE